MSYEKSVPYSLVRVSRRNYTHPAIRRDQCIWVWEEHTVGTYCLHNNARGEHSSQLQALVYDILPSTTAVFRYAIGSRKRSANEQYCVGAQIVVTLLQTTQIT